MTTELEQEFYDTFGIEKICTHTIINPEKCNRRRMTRCCGCDWLDYLNITAEKLLEMICILNETACEVLLAENIEDLKNEILKTCIKVYNTPILTSDDDEYENTAMYDKIQQLFKD